MARDPETTLIPLGHRAARFPLQAALTPTPREVHLAFPPDLKPEEWDVVDRYIRNQLVLREDAGSDDEQ